jgi:hypothetical protein
LPRGISRISTADSTAISPTALFPSTNALVLACLPLRNATAKGIFLHSQPGTASTSPCATTRYEGPYRTRKITDPEEHKKEKAKFMQLWMSNRGKENEQKWNEDSTSTEQTLQSPFTMDTRHGRLLHECAHRGDNLSNILGHSVPNAFKPVLECMKFKHTNIDNNRAVNKSGGTNVMQPHTKEQWLRAIKYKNTTSAPGRSGLSYIYTQKSNVAMRECNGF